MDKDIVVEQREVCWLIEMLHNDAPMPRYWNPSRHKKGWVWDANDAIRFVRQQDAQDYLDGEQCRLSGKTVEHVFLGEASLRQPSTDATVEDEVSQLLDWIDGLNSTDDLPGMNPVWLKEHRDLFAAALQSHSPRADAAEARVRELVQERDKARSIISGLRNIIFRGVTARKAAESERDAWKSGYEVTAQKYTDLWNSSGAELVAAEAERDKLRNEMRRIAEGNLGDAPWQANYDRIRQVALASITDEKSAESGRVE